MPTASRFEPKARMGPFVSFLGDPECKKFSSPALRSIASAGERREMREELLSQITRVLVNGGKLCASVDNFEDAIFVKRKNGLVLESTEKGVFRHLLAF